MAECSSTTLERPSRSLLKTPDGSSFAIWTISQGHASEGKELVLLSHGAFSNKKVCMGLARFIARAGFECSILEWRNHGASADSKQYFDFETIGCNEFLAAFEFLCAKHPAKKINVVTHSGGGLALCVFLIRHPEYAQRVGRTVLVSCQSCYAATSWWRNLGFRLADLASRICGTMSGKALGLGPHPESYRTMKPWFSWNIRGKFVSSVDGLDFTECLRTITSPIMSVSALGDRLIAPPLACRLFLSNFGGDKNEFLECSVANGFTENYDHGRIMLSTNASKEVWPLVLDWLRRDVESQAERGQPECSTVDTRRIAGLDGMTEAL